MRNQPKIEPSKNPPSGSTKIKTGEKKYPVHRCSRCSSKNLTIEVERVISRWHFQTDDQGFKPAIISRESEHRIIRGYCANCGKILSQEQIGEIAAAEKVGVDFKRAYNI